MDSKFWKKKWEDNEIAFHCNRPNPYLVKYLNRLNLHENSRVFLPLCGKTLDIAWLLSEGFRVVGAELVEMAVRQLFEELNLTPQISQINDMKLYSAKNIDIFVGDIFLLTSQILGSVDAVYDRAALVALPRELRSRYSQHIISITQNKPQLVICYEYDQSRMSGPPFSIGCEEITGHFERAYNLTLLESASVEGGLKGICPSKESIWLLK